MSTQPKTLLTEEQYLEIERKAETKSEFLNGEMFAMAGPTYRHIRIVQNLAHDVEDSLPNCEISTTDLRLRVKPGGLCTYPDVVVVFGTAAFIDGQHDTLTNPVVLFEVSSPSTES